MAQSPIRDTTDEARALAKRLLTEARHAALAVLDSGGAPMVSRIALTMSPSGQPLSLVSDLSAHTQALRTDPRCSLLVGEPDARGDPLTHPRMTLACCAGFFDRDRIEYAALRARFLDAIPKAKLYVDFADFSFIVFDIDSAALNGGFGKAFHLAGADLARD